MRSPFREIPKLLAYLREKVAALTLEEAADGTGVKGGAPKPKG